MSKETKKEKEKEKEEVVDAKAGTAVVPVQQGAVATPTTVRGVSLKFPFIRVGQGLSTWRVDGKSPSVGAFYIGKNKTTNTFIADAGAENGFDAILLDVVPGIMEDRPFDAGTPPKRFIGPTAEADAAKVGITLEPKPTGEVWKDTGRPKMRANGSKFCYLNLLVPAPEGEGLSAADYQLFPIGDRLWTPARVEFNKGAFRELDQTIGNLERVDKFQHRKDPNYEFTWRGKLCHVYSEEAVSKQTKNTYPFLKFSLSKVELNADERKDFTAFLASVSEIVASVDAEAGDEDL